MYLVNEFNDRGVQFRSLRAQSFEAALRWARRDKRDADIVDESGEIVASIALGDPVYIEPHHRGVGCINPNCARCA